MYVIFSLTIKKAQRFSALTLLPLYKHSGFFLISPPAVNDSFITVADRFTFNRIRR